MTCRCATPEEHAARAAEQARYSAQQREKTQLARVRELEARTPNPDEFQVVDAAVIQGELRTLLVLKVRYPSCKNCSFRGEKVMVYANADAVTALKWRRIDPHFDDPAKKHSPTHAPPPLMRFPASQWGFDTAKTVAMKLGNGEIPWPTGP